MVLFVSAPCFAWTADADVSPRLAKLRKAAEAGNAADQYKYADELAWSGMYGKEAREWYEKAASQGNACAKVSLVRHQIGDAGRDARKIKELQSRLCPDLKPSIEELEKDKSAEAAYNLADLYEAGICVKRDEKKGREYLEKASRENHDRAQFMLANELRRSNDSTGRFLELYEKSFKNGFPIAGIELAGCYFSGRGTEKNEAKADEVVKQLLELKDSGVTGIVGLAFYRGRMGFPENQERGKKLLGEAAESGNAQAEKFLKKLTGK